MAELTATERIIVERKREMFNKRADKWLKEIPSAFHGFDLDDLLASRWKNAIAASDVLVIKKWMENPTPFIILHGPSGLGKTLMGMLMTERMLRTGVITSGFYLPATRLLDGISDYSDREQGGMLGRAKQPQLLFLDDIGSGGIDMTPTRRTGLWDLIDYRWSSGKFTIVTTNLAITDNAVNSGDGQATFTVEDLVGTSAWDRMSDRQVSIPFVGKTHREKESASISDKRRAREEDRRRRTMR